MVLTFKKIGVADCCCVLCCCIIFAASFFFWKLSLTISVSLNSASTLRKTVNLSYLIFAVVDMLLLLLQKLFAACRQNLFALFRVYGIFFCAFPISLRVLLEHKGMPEFMSGALFWWGEPSRVKGVGAEHGGARQFGLLAHTVQ